MKKLFKFLRHPIGITLIALFLLAGGLVGARHIAWPFYKDFREKRWLTMAEKFHEQEDLRSAGLILRKVVDANPGSLEAWDLILKIAKGEDGPGLPHIYSQVARLRPEDEELHYEWAAAAIRNADFDEAKTAMEVIGERDTDTYHRLAATIAIGTEEFAVAEAHFKRLLELDPDDHHTALNLAIVRLQIPGEESGDEARRSLAALAEDTGGVGIAAIRALLTDALSNDRSADALRRAEELRNHPDLSFSDRLRILQTLDRYKPDEYHDYLKSVAGLAATHPVAARSLARFLNRQGHRQVLREWIESLPAEFREDQVINLEYIETLVFMQDLPTLEARLRELPWQEDDFYRFAILAQTLREQGRERETRETWQRAVIAAQGSVRDQRILYLQTVNWGWETERLDLLERIFHRHPREQWAFIELFAHYQATRNTPELTRLFARQVEVNVNDVNARNNLAYLWLLQGTNLSRAHSLANQIYNEDRQNPRFRTTYAFSLYRQGRHNESLRVFEEMDEEQRKSADRALHYGLILAANEEWNRALEATQRETVNSFFPEEDRLMSDLKSRIAEHL